MSQFDESAVKRIKALEREMERLKVKENPKPGMYAKDTYFDDLQYAMVGQKLTSPSAHIQPTASGNSINFLKSCDWNDDWVSMTIQMSHRWKTGSLIYPHIHWRQEAAVMPNVGISWMWQVQGAARNAVWTDVAHTSNVFTWTTGNLNQITKFGTITPPTGAGLSDIVFVHLWRDVANESNLFTGPEVDATTQDSAFVDSFDIHYEIDQTGSKTEYTK